MDNLNSLIPPESIGALKGRYVWNSSRHRIQNLVLFLLVTIVGVLVWMLFDINGKTMAQSALMQCMITGCLTVGAIFLGRAIYDQHHKHIKVLAMVGEHGFSIVKYNDKYQIVLDEYVQTYDSMLSIEKHERNDVSEEGIYLRTVARYVFIGADRNYTIKIKYNRYDIQLQEREGMADVKAMQAIEAAYTANKKQADVVEIQEPVEVIPSRPQPVIHIKSPIMWRDLKA